MPVVHQKSCRDTDPGRSIGSAAFNTAPTSLPTPGHQNCIWCVNFEKIKKIFSSALDATPPLCLLGEMSSQKIETASRDRIREAVGICLQKHRWCKSEKVLPKNPL